MKCIVRIITTLQVDIRIIIALSDEGRETQSTMSFQEIHCQRSVYYLSRSFDRNWLVYNNNKDVDYIIYY